MSQENKALARRWLEILNQGNLDVANEIYAPDYVDHDPTTMPEDGRGVEGAREFYSIYLQCLPRRRGNHRRASSRRGHCRHHRATADGIIEP